MMVRVKTAAIIFALKRELRSVVSSSSPLYIRGENQQQANDLFENSFEKSTKSQTMDDGRGAKNACSEREKALRLQYEKRNIMLVVWVIIIINLEWCDGE